MSATKTKSKKSRKKKYTYEQAYANVKEALAKLNELRSQLKAK